MEELIYYPGFEVRRIDWLKFALLYIDKLDPIIPPSGDSYLSSFYKHLINETDLINIHRPDYKEGATATLDALEYIEKILEAPNRYSSFFGINMMERWKKITNQTYIIFNEKYTKQWEDFCRDHNLGVQCDQGIRVHKQLAMVYMTLLAQVIADSRAVSPITDNPSLDRFYITSRRPTNNLQKKMSLARGILQLRLPANLSHIDINSIISLRNKPQFKQNLKAFNQELNRFLSSVEQGSTPDAFITSLGRAWKDFFDHIMILSSEITAFGLGLWLVVSSPANTGIQLTKEVAGGLSLLVGSTVAVRTTWKHTTTRRSTRKYLADVAKLTALPAVARKRK